MSILRVIAWNGAWLAAVLVGAELVFGSWVFGPDFGLLLNVPRNVDLRHDTSSRYPGTGISVYRKDRYGFRGSYADPSDIDVLVIGGSTTNELYIDEKDSWVEVMRRTLAEGGKRRVVVNAAVDGHSTVGHIRSFDLWFPNVPGLKPRFVVAYIGINDVFVEGQARYDAIAAEGAWARASARVRNNSAVYHLVAVVRGMIQARKVRIVHGGDKRRELVVVKEAVLPGPADHAGRIAAYRGRVAELARRIRKFGARPVIVTQRRGDSFAADGGWLATGPAAVAAQAVLAMFNRAAMAACREAGGVCIGLAGEIGLSPEDFSDAIHTRPSGSRRIGVYLARKLMGIL